MVELTAQSEATGREITELQSKVAANEANLPALVNKAVNDFFAGTSSSSTSGAPSGKRPRQLLRPDFGHARESQMDARKEDQYWNARQSLKVWPISGRDLSEAFRTFCTDKLLLSHEAVNGYGLQVKKSTGRLRDGVQDEVTVYFNNIADRDNFRLAARNLRPDDQCGINLVVPHHLRGNFRALQGLAFKLKKKGQLKRNVRFNDDNMEMEMSFP